jgi:hypothetical protein
MEPEPNPLVGDAVSRKAPMQQSTRGFQELHVLTADDDPAEGARLFTAERRSIRFDHDSSCRIDMQVETVAAEAVHRDSNVDMLQKGSQLA